MPVIPATQEVEIARIAGRGQPRQKVSETPSQPSRRGVSYLEAQEGGSLLMPALDKTQDPI
jgi:hypothetical protein